MIEATREPVSTPKRWLVYLLVFATVWLTGAFTAIDWAGFFHGFEGSFSKPSRFLRSVFCLFLAWLPLRNSIHKRDARLLASAFVLAVIGDGFLIFTEVFLAGVGAFIVCHLILTWRHARGLRAALGGPGGPRLKRNLVITGGIAVGITTVVTWMAWPAISENGNQVRDLVYMAVLTLSLWVGWSTLLHATYPRDNAWMIAVGMTSFYVCDVSLGLRTELSGLAADWCGLIPDLTYTPALMLLAISGYFWDLKWVPDP